MTSSRKSLYLHLRDDRFRGVIPPPAVASRDLPQWWKEIDYTVDPKRHPHRFGNVYDPKFWGAFSKKDAAEIKQPTVKGCPAVQDWMTSGYIIRLWTDVLLVKTEEGEIKINHGDASFDEHVHGFDVSMMFGDDSGISSKSLIKLSAPWAITGDPGVSVLYEPVPGYFDRPWRTFSGIVPVDQYPLDIKWIFEWQGPPGEHLIPAGTPIIRILPVFRTNFSLEAGKDIDPATERSRCPYFMLRKAVAEKWSFLSKLTSNRLADEN